MSVSLVCCAKHLEISLRKVQRNAWHFEEREFGRKSSRRKEIIALTVSTKSAWISNYITLRKRGDKKKKEKNAGWIGDDGRKGRLLENCSRKKKRNEDVSPGVCGDRYILFFVPLVFNFSTFVRRSSRWYFRPAGCLGCSILGMYLFGGKFCMWADRSRPCTCAEVVSRHPMCRCDRKHFNDIVWALVTVFQVPLFPSLSLSNTEK